MSMNGRNETKLNHCGRTVRAPTSGSSWTRRSVECCEPAIVGCHYQPLYRPLSTSISRNRSEELADKRVILLYCCSMLIDWQHGMGESGLITNWQSLPLGSVQLYFCVSIGALALTQFIIHYHTTVMDLSDDWPAARWGMHKWGTSNEGAIMM